MATRLLDDQHIRRRRTRRRKADGLGRTRRETVLYRQTVERFSDELRERVATAARVAVLVLAIAGLITGLVVIGGDLAASTAFSTAVVADDVERALAPFPGAMSDDAALPAEVSFERTEDTEYVVTEGETLSEIADRFDLSYDTLAAYNHIGDPDTVMPGQHILIPSIDTLSDLGA